MEQETGMAAPVLPAVTTFYWPETSSVRPPLQLPADFSATGYLECNPDVRAAGVDPAQHYFRHGWYEGRRWSSRAEP